MVIEEEVYSIGATNPNRGMVNRHSLPITRPHNDFSVFLLFLTFIE